MVRQARLLLYPCREVEAMDNIHGAHWDGWDPPEVYDCAGCEAEGVEHPGALCDWCELAEGYDVDATMTEMYIAYLRMEKQGADEEALAAQRKMMTDWDDRPWEVVERACKLELKKQRASAE